MQRKEAALAKQVESLQRILTQTQAKHAEAKEAIIKLRAQQDAALARARKQQPQQRQPQHKYSSA